MTEPLTLDILTPNPKNPRRDWKPEQVQDFIASLRRFGDLGGIVRNLETGHLVGGHKRVEVFRQSTAVEIVKVDQPIDAQGTVAHGYVLVDGNRFAYREVQWTHDVEVAANLAANRWGAAWDWEAVAMSLQSIEDLGLHPLTGFADHELKNLLAAEWNPAAVTEMPNEASPHVVRFSNEQYAVLGHAKTAVVAATGRTDLTDADVVMAVCEAYLQGREDDTTSNEAIAPADRAPRNGQRHRRGQPKHQQPRAKSGR